MKNKRKSIIFLSLLITTIGCSKSLADDNSNVTWSTGFSLSELLASPIKINAIEDIPSLINAYWYDSFTFNSTDNKEINIYSCQDYFNHTDITIKNSYDINPFLQIKTMCDAAKYLIEAKPYTYSYIPSSYLAENLPILLPKELAIQTSTNEYNRNLNNKSLRSWDDIKPITKFTPISDNKAIYHFDGGFQEIETVGRGDFNNDGLEDILILSRDNLSDGSYFNLRLIPLSVDKNNQWFILNK